MSQFKRHPAGVAVDNWLGSPEGQKCIAGTTYGVYLRNRILRAFQAGWDAHEKHVSPSPVSQESGK